MKILPISLVVAVLLASIALAQTTTTQSKCGNSYCDFYETKENCASDCTFAGANCAQGAIPSTGCTCNRGNSQGYITETSGYCCWGSYSPTPCATELKTCTDSDSGVDVYVKGSGSGNYKGATIRAYQTYEDTCVTSTQLNEAHCDSSSGMLSVAGLVCPNGCKDGVCLQPATTTTSASTSSTTTATLQPTTTTVIQSTITEKLGETSNEPPSEPPVRTNEVRPLPPLPVEPIPQPEGTPLGKTYYPHKDFPLESKKEFEIEKLYVNNENPGVREKIEITCITNRESDIITFKIYSPNGKTDKIWGTLAWGITIPYSNLDVLGKYDVECIAEGHGKQIIKSTSFVVGGQGITRTTLSKKCISLPLDIKENCEGSGGKLYLKYDDSDPSCIVKFNCIRPENETQIREEVEREEIYIPTSDILLKLAFKLEEIKLSFAQLSEKSLTIANYYSSISKTGEQQKFQKIASAFDAAGGRVQEIEDFLRLKLDTITKEDILKTKQDLVYIKKIVLKDILFLMLSKAEEVSPDTIPFPTAPPGQEQVAASAPTAGGGSVPGPLSPSLGNDMYPSFLEGFRLCKQGARYDHKEIGTYIIEVKGFDGKNCLIHAELFGIGPDGGRSSTSATAECKNSNYALGFRGEYTFFKESKCEGTLMQFLEAHPLLPSPPQIAPPLKSLSIAKPVCPDTSKLEKEIDDICFRQGRFFHIVQDVNGCRSYYCTAVQKNLRPEGEACKTIKDCREKENCIDGKCVSEFAPPK